MKLKFCGFKTLEDVNKAKDLNIDAIGFIHFPQSKRFVDLEKIQTLTKIVPNDKEKVVIVVDPNNPTLSKLIDGTDMTTIQLPGNESLETIDLISKRKKSSKINKASSATSV